MIHIGVLVQEELLDGKSSDPGHGIETRQRERGDGQIDQRKTHVMVEVQHSEESGDGTGENLLRCTGRDHSFRRDGSDSDQEMMPSRDSTSMAP